MLLALQDMGAAGRIKLVGFSASQILIDALRNGQLEGIVVQNPMRMGYLGVMTRPQPIWTRPKRSSS